VPFNRERNFWLFFVGQTISSFGTSFTRFALPLLVYELTGSPLSLALTTALTFLPVVLFGLLIGVWVDLVDRKRLMIGANMGRAVIIAALPVLAGVHLLSVGWIYIVAFLSSVLAMCFETGQFAAVASLVSADDLMRANGRLQASYAMATITGSVLGGAALAVIALPALLVIDAASFLVSAGSLALITSSFNNVHAVREPASTNLRTGLRKGLRYVWDQPVLRSIVALFVAVNAFAPTVSAQLVLFVKRDLRADNAHVGIFYGAGSLGVAVLALGAGRVHRRYPYGIIVLGALMLNGVLTVALALTRWYDLALLLWAAISGLTALGDIATGSLTQARTPGALMGRVTSVSRVLAWSTIPLGTMVGGFLVARTKQVTLVYAVIGTLIVLIAWIFSFTPLRRAD